MSVHKNRRKRQNNRCAPGGHRSVGALLAPAVKSAVTAVFLLVMGTVFVFVHDLITQCDTFRVQRIEVEGARRLTREQVLALAQIRPGVNVMAVNLTLARKRLLAHPMIVSASVGRDLPATLVVRIEEHEPLAVLDLGRKFLINTQGEIFKELEGSDPEHLPLISGLTFADITTAGRSQSRPFEAVMTVLKLGQDLDGPLPNPKIATIAVDREIGLTILTKDRIKVVKLGYDDYGEKFRQLGTLSLRLGPRSPFGELETVDLNNLQRIVVTPSVAPPEPQDPPKEV